MTKKEKERNNALMYLLNYMKPGKTIYTKIEYVNQAGDSKGVSFYIANKDCIINITYYVALLLEKSLTKKGYMMVSTTGDAGHHAVTALSNVIYPHGFGCIGDGCPSADHINGDRSYEKHVNGKVAHWHDSGSYALVKISL